MFKPGITAKLFLAILASCVLVAMAMGLASRLTFNRGFLGYLNDQGVERMDALLPALASTWPVVPSSTASVPTGWAAPACSTLNFLKRNAGNDMGTDKGDDILTRR